jgi:hypothetical protein
MEYICDEIILVIEYEKLHIYIYIYIYIYISNGLWVEFFVDYFVMDDMDIHQLSFKPFRILEFFLENPFKKCVFLHLFTNKYII